ncbi:DUF6340 family protein [Saccharicrinis sp. FJH54]|uniref:DUF6340 family protein n=1 Tax=Saccharicrinis sp. FJH54 TaxID=3344665 RepID=UPI0035D4AFD7
MSKSNFHSIVVIFIVLIFSSCVAQKELTIEVLKPAKDPVAGDFRSILLVDNTVQQPATLGNFLTTRRYNYTGKLRSQSRTELKDTLKVDSLGISCVLNAANILNQEDFLDTVMVKEKNLSDRSRVWTNQMLSPNKVLNLADSNQVDVIATLDMFSYVNDLVYHVLPENWFMAYENQSNYSAYTEYYTIWRFYDARTLKLLATKTHRDTLFFELDYMEVNDENRQGLLETLVAEAAWDAGRTSISDVFPGWKKVQRVYYKSGSPGLRIGGKYYENGKPDEALREWKRVYDTATGKNKARAALNIAFYYELHDKLDKTMEYLVNARYIYLDSRVLSESSPDYELIKSYIDVIEKRLKEDKRIKNQLKNELNG